MDYLPPIYQHDFVMVAPLPKAVSAYDTLFYPFDKYIWVALLAVTGLQLLTFVVLEHLWKQKTGFFSSTDYPYECE